MPQQSVRGLKSRRLKRVKKKIKKIRIKKKNSKVHCTKILHTKNKLFFPDWRQLCNGESPPSSILGLGRRYRLCQMEGAPVSAAQSAELTQPEDGLQHWGDCKPGHPWWHTFSTAWVSPTRRIQIRILGPSPTGSVSGALVCSASALEQLR